MKIKFRGFTLIELMIVIAIISILMAIMFPQFVRMRAQAKYSACLSNLKNIGTALESYRAQKQEYPSVDQFANGTEFTGASGFLSSIPRCPSSEADYVYTLSDDGMDYAVYCPDGYNSHTLIFGSDKPYPQFGSSIQLVPRPPKDSP